MFFCYLLFLTIIPIGFPSLRVAPEAHSLTGSCNPSLHNTSCSEGTAQSKAKDETQQHWGGLPLQNGGTPPPQNGGTPHHRTGTPPTAERGHPPLQNGDTPSLQNGGTPPLQNGGTPPPLSRVTPPPQNGGTPSLQNRGTLTSNRLELQEGRGDSAA